MWPLPNVFGLPVSHPRRRRPSRHPLRPKHPCNRRRGLPRPTRQLPRLPPTLPMDSQEPVNPIRPRNRSATAQAHFLHAYARRRPCRKVNGRGVLRHRHKRSLCGNFNRTDYTICDRSCLGSVQRSGDACLSRW